MAAQYPRLHEVEEVCKSFIGQHIALVASFMGRQVPITNPNLVGDLLEDLVFPILKEKFPDFEEGPKQDPPDYYAGNKEFAFEQKAFLGSPGFDLANYGNLCVSIAENLIMKIFKTKYLVFEYRPDGNGFKIANFWLLNLWQLPQYDGKNPMSLQVKRGVWYNLRPGAASSWSDPTKTPQKFLDKLLHSMDLCPNLQNKDALKLAIQRQIEDAKTQGFL